MTNLVRWQTYFLTKIESGLLDPRRVFKATFAYYTALKSTEESMRTASLKDITGLEDVEGRLYN